MVLKVLLLCDTNVDTLEKNERNASSQLKSNRTCKDYEVEESTSETRGEREDGFEG